MKKTAALILALTLTAALAGCGAPASASLPEPAGNTEVRADPHDLYLLQTGSEAGRYGTVYRNDHTILCYIDYASASDTALCAQPSCNHDSDSCTAYIPGGDVVSALCALDGGKMAFIVSPGQESDRGSILYLADSAGGERRKLFRAESGEDFWELTCADDAYLYFPIQIMEGDNTVTRLCRVPLSGGEAEPLFDWDDAHVIGVDGRDLVCQSTRYEESGEQPVLPDNASQEELNRLSHEYLSSCKGSSRVFLHNMDDGTETELDSWDVTMDNDDRVLLWQDGRLYWCETGWNRLPQAFHWTAADGQTGEVELSWPEELRQEVENDPNETAGVSRLETVVENHALLQITGKENQLHRYGVDLSDGSVTEIPLRYESNGKEQPVAILGRSGDSLLVEMEVQMKEVTYIQQDGTPTTNGAAVGRYALIAFDDFLAGRPAYREINTQYIETIW